MARTLLFIISLFLTLLLAQKYEPYSCDYKEQNRILSEFKLTPTDASTMVGYSEVRQEMEQMLINPIKYPNEYKGLIGSGRGILIFGPPGTGKTLMLSTFVDQLSNLSWTILKIKPSDVMVSAWQGETEQRFECIFKTARQKRNVVLLFDEGENFFQDRATMSQSDTVGRSLITIALNQMNDMKDYRTVVITNVPQSIDFAVRRRVGFSFCMRLPDPVERKELFCKLFNEDGWKIHEQFNYTVLNTSTDLFSGDDILRLAQVMCRDKVKNAKEFPLRKFATPFSLQDLDSALKRVKPTSTIEELKKIAEYAIEHSNPCFTEYLKPSPQNKRMVNAWDFDNPHGETPAEFKDNVAYKISAHQQRSWLSSEADERLFQALSGKPSRSYCDKQQDSEKEDENFIPYILFASIGSLILIFSVVATVMICRKEKNEMEPIGYEIVD